ncbi:hypothetical protein E2562_035565 [Oryza meyeriana var. granulata]|nr:hypothetical protein E2562_035565 [Oryza meyeriana var. granulata]
MQPSLLHAADRAARPLPLLSDGKRGIHSMPDAGLDPCRRRSPHAASSRRRPRRPAFSTSPPRSLFSTSSSSPPLARLHSASISKYYRQKPIQTTFEAITYKSRRWKGLKKRHEKLKRKKLRTTDRCQRARKR